MLSDASKSTVIQYSVKNWSTCLSIYNFRKLITSNLYKMNVYKGVTGENHCTEIEIGDWNYNRIKIDQILFWKFISKIFKVWKVTSRTASVTCFIEWRIFSHVITRIVFGWEILLTQISNLKKSLEIFSGKSSEWSPVFWKYFPGFGNMG